MMNNVAGNTKRFPHYKNKLSQSSRIVDKKQFPQTMSPTQNSPLSPRSDHLVLDSLQL